MRVIDWEIAALGDGLWDIAGIVHFAAYPEPDGRSPTAALAQTRAQALIGALWSGYVEVCPPPAPPTLLRLAGARLVEPARRARSP